MVVTISPKGQVVIPAKLRRKYRIIPGSKVRIMDGNGKLIVTFPSSDPVNQAHGILQGGDSLTKALLESRREECAREEAQDTCSIVMLS